MPTLSLSATTGIYVNLLFYFGLLAAIWSLETDDNINYRESFIFGCLAFISVLIMISIWFFNSSLLKASSYQNLIGEIVTSEFNAHVQPIPTDQMVIVDEEIAERIGEKLLGSDPGLGSRAKLGSFTRQVVQGKLYWIAPLEHRGFFKWYRFSNEGTPGYVRVSATNQEDYALITKDSKGNDLHIHYQTKSYFSQSLWRYIYRNGYCSTIYTDLSFEVDDNWDPYWTVTLYDSKIGFGGNDAIGIISVNPSDGSIIEYSLDELPGWIDRVHPEEFIYNQISDWGELIHGWYNPSDEDKLSVNQDYSMVIGSDGKSYFYYGLTSKGTEESTVGFVMVDTRTKKAHWFKQAGATEAAAKKSAQGKYPEKGYTSSEGITYNISGHATYEFLLKDGAGLMKMIGLVNVHDHTIVGIGENRQEAMREYESELNNRGNNVAVNETEMELENVTSSIKRFGNEVVKGTTYYYFILSDNSKIKFSASSNVSTDLVLTKEGDKVFIQYVSGTSKIISIMKFKNLTIGINDDETDLLKQSIDSIKISRIKKSNEKVMDAKWEDLSIEDKNKLLRR